MADSEEDGFESKVSADGTLVTFTVTQNGQPVKFELAAEKLPHLMMFVGEAATKAIRIREGHPSAFHILPVAEWRCLPHPDGEHAVMQFRIEHGPETSFQLAKSRIPEMIASLQKLLGAPPSSKRQH